MPSVWAASGVDDHKLSMKGVLLAEMKGVSHAEHQRCVMCCDLPHMPLQIYRITNPEVPFDVLGTKQRQSDQSSKSSCSQVSQCGWL